MAKFYLNGDIVDNGQEWDGSVSPKMLKEFIDGLQDGEDIEVEITSFGGSCTAGNAMVSMLRNANANGHHTRAHIVSIAASMASVVACACDELIIDSNAFLMVHLPWTTVEGNYETMRKEADTLELFTKSLVSVYRTKFNLSDDEIVSMLQAETWILGSDANTYGLKCSINEVDGELKIAASLKGGKCKQFKNVPMRILGMEDKIEEAVKTGDEAIEQLKDEVVVEADTTPMEENVVEETTPVEAIPTENDEVLNKEEVLAKYAEYEKTIEELKNENASLKSQIAEYERKAKANIEVEDDAKELISKEECEKRVSGMQSKMQAKINDFVSQLKVKDEELNKVRAELTSLNQRLEEANGELSKMASALEEKNNALAQLNAGVLRPAEELPTMEDGLAKCATPKERVDFLKSGKFVR